MVQQEVGKYVWFTHFIDKLNWHPPNKIQYNLSHHLQFLNKHKIAQIENTKLIR